MTLGAGTGSVFTREDSIIFMMTQMTNQVCVRLRDLCFVTAALLLLQGIVFQPTATSPERAVSDRGARRIERQG